MDRATQASIVDALEEMVVELAPDAHLRPMYGGTVIELEKGNPKSRIGGIYAYKDHVSLEFSNGARMVDPNGVLEGSGKLRRHVKLCNKDDIDKKACRTLLGEAMVQADIS